MSKDLKTISLIKETVVYKCIVVMTDLHYPDRVYHD